MPRWTLYLFALIFVVLIAVALAAPIGPMPGFRLGGNDAVAPENWSSMTLPEEVRLANYSGVLPYVVTIWVVESDNRLYVIGDPDSTWVKGATASPDVRVRIGDKAYDLRATRLEHGPQRLFEKYIDRYKDSYPDIIASFPPLEEFAQGAALFELTRR